SPIIDDRGHVTGVVLVFRDITQRRRAEEAEALQALNARIDEAVRGSSLGVWVNEMPDGDPARGRTHVWNVLERPGYPGRAYGDHSAFRELIPPDDLPGVIEAQQRYFRGEIPSYEIQCRLRHADGSYRWFLNRGVVTRNAQGVPVRFAGTSVDMTARRAAE